MTPSELADELEKHESNGHMETFHTLMFLYRDSIIKSLRFAADMDILESYDIQIERGGQPEDEWLITFWPERKREIQVSDKSIYSAARKAVEALKGENE